MPIVPGHQKLTTTEPYFRYSSLTRSAWKIKFEILLVSLKNYGSGYSNIYWLSCFYRPQTQVVTFAEIIQRTQQDAISQGWGNANCSCVLNNGYCNELSNNFAIAHPKAKNPITADMVLEVFQDVRANNYAETLLAENAEEGGYFDDEEE